MFYGEENKVVHCSFCNLCDRRNHYEGIHRIEFNDIEKNEVTGSRNVLLTINKEIKMEITFFKFNDRTDNYVISWYKKLGLTEKNAATNLKAINDVEVKYWSK